MPTKTKERLITVYDERYGNMDDYTLKEIKEWLDFEAPSWCQEIHLMTESYVVLVMWAKGDIEK